MIERFISLTGDHSSLHANTTFSRRSMYREDVVHGMLPIIFVSALECCYAEGGRCSFYQISARFVKPIFVNDKLSMDVKVSEINRKENLFKLDFVIRKSEKETILTMGSFTVRYSDFEKNKAPLGEPEQPDRENRMVLDSLAEEDLEFEQISKGDEKSFRFLIREAHARSLYEIIKEGLLTDCKFDLASWLNSCDTANLLSACLFSTFVGMCLPGRNATFMDFRATFNKPIQRNKRYSLKGNVGFKSLSTDTLVENISIYDIKDRKDPCAVGKINTRVNKPPIKMPSIKSLKANDSDLRLKDKVVLITGSSRGIGETTAKLFSLYGAKVVINYFQGKEDAKRIVDEIVGNGGKAIAIQSDVSDRQQVKQMISAICKKYRTIHILVNNAVSNAHAVPFMDLTWEDIQRDIDIIVKGAFNCCQEVLPLMLENKGGKIINISTVSTDNPPPDQTKYVIAKSGIVGLTRSLAVEFAQYNIQVNMVAPSIVETDLTKHVSKIFLEDMKRTTPMKRNASPIDVAKTVIFLSSSLALFTTGQKIMVTGGNLPFL